MHAIRTVKVAISLQGKGKETKLQKQKCTAGAASVGSVNPLQTTEAGTTAISCT